MSKGPNSFVWSIETLNNWGLKCIYIFKLGLQNDFELLRNLSYRSLNYRGSTVSNKTSVWQKTLACSSKIKLTRQEAIYTITEVTYCCKYYLFRFSYLITALWHHKALLCSPLYFRWGGHIVFGADPVSVRVGIDVSYTRSCLHNILWTSVWILTKFVWIYNWDITKNWFDFGDLDLIFSVTAEEKLKIHGEGTSVFSENTVTS